jgi:hypothetical protein
MRPIQLLLTTLFSAAVAAGCSTATQGARPHDMSAEGHEQHAAREDAAARAHEGQYDAGATAQRKTCGASRATYDSCWSSSVNPTDSHRAEAERHRKMAADHRAASTALRDAEARSCGGVPESDRDTSPFHHREDIVNVSRITGTPRGKQASAPVAGAKIVFRAVPEMTQEWLQRVVDCHVARNASMGFDMPEMATCPLGVKGAQAQVTSTGDGFAVTIRSDDPQAAEEIARRAERLTSGR